MANIESIKDFQFKPGEGGRPKGIPNKITRMVRDVFAEVFNELQTEDEYKHYSLKEWATREPTEFYKLASKLIPVQVINQNEQPLQVDITQGLTFEQLYELKWGHKPGEEPPQAHDNKAVIHIKAKDNEV